MNGGTVATAVSIAALLFAAIGCDRPSENAGNPEEPTADEAPEGIAQLDSLSKLLGSSPADPQLLNERAKVFLQIGELNLAVADVGRALLIDSTRAEYFLTISDVYFRMGEPKRCKNALLKARKLQPDDPEPLHRLAQFELYLKNYQQSISYANDMLGSDARDDRPFMIKGLCYKELGDTSKAIHNYLEAISENPENYDAYVELGVLHWSKGDPLAEQYLKAALDIRPEAIDALYALGMHYQDADKLNDALETYARILAMDSTYRSAHFNIGYIKYQYLQLYNEALLSFDRAVKTDSQYYQAIYMRGLCYEAKGDVNRAKREYSYAIEVNPNYRKAAEGLRRILGKTPE